MKFNDQPGVTPFTDEDLRELKEDIASPAFFFNGLDNRLRPLLARLEAAEHIVTFAVEYQLNKVEREALKDAKGVWREFKGE